MSASTTLDPTRAAPELWTCAETAEYLRVDRATVRAWTKAGKLPAARRIGQQLRFRAAEIRALVANATAPRG